MALNRELVGGYIQAFRAAAAEFGLAAEPDLNAILRVPERLKLRRCRSDENLESAVLQKAQEALHALNHMREEEGRGIERELRERMQHSQQASEGVEKHRHAVLQTYRGQAERPHAGTAGIADRSASASCRKPRCWSIAATSRRNWCGCILTWSTFSGCSTSRGEIGKKLDFLLQEMNREANTLLSKTSGLAGEALNITEMGLAMKSEIEKAREQVQNVE